MADERRLTETEIRPEDLVAQQAALFARDVEWLAARRGDFVTVTCPACSADRPVLKFEKSGFRYVECERCLTLYMNPRAAPALLGEYYQRSENYRFWADVLFPATEATRRARIFRPRANRVVELCGTYRARGRTLLEVGSGFGTFLDEIRATAAFDRVVGIEPTPSLAAQCRARGLDIIESRVEDVVFSDIEAPTVIASFETIEHLFDPGAFMSACARILAPGGLLVLTCPNGRGFDVVTLGAGSDTVDAEHINLFNPSSLGVLASSRDFEVVEVLTPGQLDVDLVRRALAGRDEMHPFLRQLLFEVDAEVADRFQVFLTENNLSSHMWLVARKRSEA